MSDQDRPGNPFGRGERTVIRPNPGGRAPPPRPQPAPIPPSPGPPNPSASPPSPVPGDPFGPGPAPPAARTSATSPSPHAAAPTTHAAEDWIKSAAPPPPSLPVESFGPTLRVDDLVAPNANPIMRAAG